MSDKKNDDYKSGEHDGFWKGVLATLGGVATLIGAIIAGSKTLGK
jgi:hypothetical protein